MKLNKQELEALKAMQRICKAYLEDDKPVSITGKEATAIRVVLGIDLDEVCIKKGDIIECVRGKDGVHISRAHGYVPGQDIPKKLHFIFQVKSRKPHKSV